MIRKDVTWGDLRSIHNNASASGGYNPDDLLADPKIMDESLDKDDDEYYYDLSDKEKEFYKSLDEEADIDARKGTYSVTITDDGNVLELVKILEDGSMFARRQGMWLEIGPDDPAPTIFDQTMEEVTDNLVPYWDRLKEAQAPINSEAIQDFLA